MAGAFFQWLTRNPVNMALALIGFYFVVTLVDLGFYFSFVARGGGGLLAALNPLRYFRYLLSPLGLFMGLVLYSPLIVALLVPKTIESVFSKREQR